MSDARWRELEIQQNDLNADATVVSEYGRAREGEWGRLRLVREPTVAIEAAFTNHLDEHRAALTGMLEHTDRLRVVSAKYSDAALTAIRDEAVDWLRSHHPGALTRAGKGWDAVDVHLDATATAAAQALWDRYGDALRLIVGAKPFPPSREPVLSGPPATLPDGAADIGGVRAEIVLGSTEVPSGTTVPGRIVFHNHGDQPVKIHGGQMVGSVVRPGTNEIVGVFIGPIQAYGLTVSMSPGGHGELPLLVGTASVLPGSDPLLPPGDYEAVAVVHPLVTDVLVARTALALT